MAKHVIEVWRAPGAIVGVAVNRAARWETVWEDSSDFATLDYFKQCKQNFEKVRWTWKEKIEP